MKPYLHAKNSVNEWGGCLSDYERIHNFIDHSKSAVADMRHRVIFHSAFGIYIVEQVFGYTITNSDNKVISVRDVCEKHIIEDLGFIPSLDHWLKNMQIQDWMLGGRRKEVKEKFIKID